MDMNTTSQSKAASDELWDRAWDLLNGMETKLLQVKNMNEILFMASERINDRNQMDAVAAQCDVIAGVIREVLDIREGVASMILGRVPA